MSKINYLKKCKICDNDDLIEVLVLSEQYLSPCFVKSNDTSDLKEIKTPLSLMLCSLEKNNEACGHLQLLQEVDADILYRKYFYRSATSQTMKIDLKDVVEKVSSLITLKSNDVVVDIGSNDNTLLNFYRENCQFVGFEPARNINHIDEGKNIKVISNYFNATEFKKFYSDKVKIVTSCAMFYDLSEPKKFVNDINDILDEDGLWCVQISYLLSMIKNVNFYDICHEHLSYYSLKVFERLIDEFNLKVFDAELNAVNGGSIRIYVCKKNNNKFENQERLDNLNNIRKEEAKFKLDHKETFYEYQKIIDNLKDKTNKYVNDIIKSGKKIIGLGASTKGNILLQHFGLEKDKIEFISEKNPYKVGLKCVGTDIELISEERARELNPCSMIVLPWYFKDEIVKREKEYINSGGELFFPMPYPHIVKSKGETKL